MKKLFVILLFLSFTMVNAQGVDLPEFVIKGVKKVALPKIEKSKHDFIKPLSNEYFKHKFKPEDFDVSFVAKVDTIITHPFFRKQSFKGRIKAAGGINTLPFGEGFISYSNDNILFTLGGNAKSVKNYSPYSSFLSGSGNFNFEYYPERKGENKSFNVFGLHGKGQYFDGNFWASAKPFTNRQIALGEAGFYFENFFEDQHRITVNFNGNYFVLPKENIREQNYAGSGLFSYNINPFKLNLEGGFQMQSILRPLYRKYIYYSGKADVELEMSKNVYVHFGAVSAFLNNDVFFYPILGLKYNVSKYFLLSGNIEGNSSFKTNSDFAVINPYYKATGFTNTFTREANKISIAARFNYYNMINATLEAYYSTTDGFPYFDDSVNKGIFEIKTLDKISTIALKFNGDFLHSKYGYLSIKSILREVRQQNKNIVPYTPGIIVDANYNFTYNERISLSFGVKYFSEIFGDINNQKRIEPFTDLYFEGAYRIFKELKITANVNNILNKNNFIYEGYKTTPFDVLVGVQYFWK